jgi:uncharacterized protein (DUF927 family)
VGVAGEIATKYGLTGWPEGEAIRAAATCFLSWLNLFGCRGHREERKLLVQVRSFLEANGSSRFENVNGDDGQRVVNRCGFFHVVESELNKDGKPVPDVRRFPIRGLREYLVLPEAFRNELCAGFDFKFAVAVLKKHGFLIPGSDRTAQSVTLPGIGKTRVYVISPKVWEGAE